MKNDIASFARPQCLEFTVTFHQRESAAVDIAALGERVVEFLKDHAVCPEWSNCLHLAVEELFTNLAKYGQVENPSAGPLLARGKITLGTETAALVVTDNSLPFDPGNAVAAVDVSSDILERSIGGLGLFMLMNMFNELKYQRVLGKNVSVWTLNTSSSKAGSGIL